MPVEGGVGAAVGSKRARADARRGGRQAPAACGRQGGRWWQGGALGRFAAADEAALARARHSPPPAAAFLKRAEGGEAEGARRAAGCSVSADA